MLDNSIIKEAKKGDFIAFEKIVTEYEALVYNTCYKLLSNVEDSRDATQDTFVKVYKNLSKFNEDSNLKAWIYTIAYNTCLDIIRKRKEVISLDDDEKFIEIKDKANVEADVLNKEKRNVILKSLNKLSFEHKSLIVLRDIDGYSYEEISQIMKIPLGSVKSGISRGRKKLKEIIEKSGEL